MKRTGRRVASFVIILIAGTLLGLWYWHWQSITPRVRADFEWFSTLGFPDVKGCPYVRVATGRWSRSENEPPQNYYFDAFLLSTNDNSFTVLTEDLFVRMFTNTVGSVPEHRRVGFEMLKLEEQVKLILNDLEEPSSDKYSSTTLTMPLSGRAKVFALAWACWRQGQDANARRLYEQAKLLPRGQGGKRTKGTLRVKIKELWQEIVGQFKSRAAKPTFHENLEIDFGHALMWRAIVNFGDTSISRTQLLSQLETIIHKCPHSEHCARARQTAEMLKRMIAEDQQHKIGTNEFARLNTEEKVRELIFQLRDQHGEQREQPGSCEIFWNSQGLTNTPAHQLVAMRYSAVPQLVSALDSPTLTRSVGYHGDFYFSHVVVTVGNCAAVILQEITGKSFSTRQAAETWWTDFQKKGEKQMLIEAVEAGGYDAPAQAKFLCQRYPDVACEPLMRGVKAAGNSWIRSQLIEKIAEVGDGPGVEFLRDEMLNGPIRSCRVSAAYGLLRHGDKEAIQAMIREWKNFFDGGSYNDEGVGQLIIFLVGCDSVEAVAALEGRFSEHPLALKLRIVDALGETGWPYVWLRDKVLSTETLAAIEKCLVAALKDTEEWTGMNGSRNRKNYSNARVCDMAAHFLVQRWPERYKFDLGAPFETRDGQRVECLNVWRRAHNLSSGPSSGRSFTKVGRDESTTVTAIEWSAGSVKLESAFEEQIEKFKDKTLQGAELAELLSGFAREPASGVAGLEITFLRGEDLTGVRMLVNLIHGLTPMVAQNWNVTKRVSLGSESLLYSSEGGKLETYTKPDNWTDLVEAVKKVVTGASKTPFEISVRIKADREN